MSKGLRASDQTRLCPALIALRDKYRAKAIRVWDKFQDRMSAGKVSAKTMLQWQYGRDYYIESAESISKLLPAESQSNPETAAETSEGQSVTDARSDEAVSTAASEDLCAANAGMAQETSSPLEETESNSANAL